MDYSRRTKTKGQTSDKVGLIEEQGEKMNTTLLIMAAGIGSRFGTGIKQLELVDYNGLIN